MIMPRHLLAAIAATCAVTCVAVPEDPTISCPDGSICPSDKVCIPAGGGCVGADQLDACAGRVEGGSCVLVGIGEGKCRDLICVFAYCGDAIVDAGEQCDDGNLVNDDACTVNCQAARCGDGIVQSPEACDLVVGNDDQGECTSACALATCGDGLVYLGVEACDDGNTAAGDGCDPACQLEGAVVGG